MLRYLKTSPVFYNSLRDKVRQWLALPEVEFECAWKKVDAVFDQEPLGLISSFNADTWLIQCVEAIFPELKEKRNEVERLFFEVRGEGDFGPHLIGKEIPWTSAANGKAKIIGVALSEGFGMNYRFIDSSGHIFHIEKFD